MLCADQPWVDSSCSAIASVIWVSSVYEPGRCRGLEDVAVAAQPVVASHEVGRAGLEATAVGVTDRQLDHDELLL
jgi:hypothetical protein